MMTIDYEDTAVVVQTTTAQGEVQRWSSVQEAFTESDINSAIVEIVWYRFLIPLSVAEESAPRREQIRFVRDVGRGAWVFNATELSGHSGGPLNIDWRDHVTLSGRME